MRYSPSAETTISGSVFLSVDNEDEHTQLILNLGHNIRQSSLIFGGRLRGRPFMTQVGKVSLRGYQRLRGALELWVG